MRLTATQLVHLLLENDTIACDLDGTLAKTTPEPFDKNKIGEPIPAMVRKIRAWLAADKKVVIFTARAAEKSNVPPIKKWLKKHGLPDLEITNEKTPEMTLFVDDRARAVTRNKGTYSHTHHQH